MTPWMEKFLAGLFAGWFAIRRGHKKPSKRDKEHAEACASSTRYTFNALLGSRVVPEIEENEPMHIEEWGRECWCGETHGRLKLVQN